MRKTKICSGCNQDKIIWKSEGKDKYCQSCWNKIKPTKSPTKSPTKTIKPLAVRRGKQKEIYSTIRELYLKNHEFCEIRLPICTQWAIEIHHTKGRVEELLYDIRHFKAVCRACHDWIENHPEAATEMGYSESRLDTDVHQEQ